MQQTHALQLSIRKLGKLDDLVREKGKNNKDGWDYTVQPDDERVSLPPRKPNKRFFFLFR